MLFFSKFPSVSNPATTQRNDHSNYRYRHLKSDRRAIHFNSTQYTLFKFIWNQTRYLNQSIKKYSRLIVRMRLQIPILQNYFCQNFHIQLWENKSQWRTIIYKRPNFSINKVTSYISTFWSGPTHQFFNPKKSHFEMLTVNVFLANLPKSSSRSLYII